jgi:hypothetical protein
MSLADRIAKIEASVLSRRADNIPAIVLTLSAEQEDPEWPLVTEVGGQELRQAPEEDESAFKERALAAARLQHDGDPMRPLLIVATRKAQPTG